MISRFNDRWRETLERITFPNWSKYGIEVHTLRDETYIRHLYGSNLVTFRLNIGSLYCSVLYSIHRLYLKFYLRQISESSFHLYGNKYDTIYEEKFFRARVLLLKIKNSTINR